MPLRYLILVPAFLIIFVLAMIVWILYYPTGPATSTAQPPPATQQAKPNSLPTRAQTPALPTLPSGCLHCQLPELPFGPVCADAAAFPAQSMESGSAKMVEAYKASIPSTAAGTDRKLSNRGYGTEDNT